MNEKIKKPLEKSNLNFVYFFDKSDKESKHLADFIKNKLIQINYYHYVNFDFINIGLPTFKLDKFCESKKFKKANIIFIEKKIINLIGEQNLTNKEVNILDKESFEVAEKLAETYNNFYYDVFDKIGEYINNYYGKIKCFQIANRNTCEISITEDDANRIFDYEVLDADSYAKVFYFLTYVPNGVQVMSASIPDMVESSLNLGVFRIEDDYVKGVVSLRSQKESYKDYMTKKLEGIASMIEAEFIVSGEYPGYDMTPESEFRDVMCDAYEEVFKRKPVIAAIHAGLEIGVLSEKIPGLDVISIGPDTFDIHTVEEKVEIASIERVEAFIRKAIEKYCSIFGQNA